MRLQLIQARRGRYPVCSCLVAKLLSIIKEVSSAVQSDADAICAVAPCPVG